jgi:pyruvate/2-oxoglutarate dehydrogenase complex dihydrolipoamide acyltransferase (E2) component
MDVPAPLAGTVAEVVVNVGDTASEGTVVAKIGAADDAAAPSRDRAARAESFPRTCGPFNEMAGGTFTIGGIGGTSFTPIVNAPQVGILGIVHSAMKPVWDGKEFVGRLMLPLSLSYDHRVIDGAAAARFMTSQTPAVPKACPSASSWDRSFLRASCSVL